jgi:hypothetical protein
MNNKLWDKEFLSSHDAIKYSWANKLGVELLDKYGIFFTLENSVNEQNRLYFTYSFKIKRKYVYALNKYIIDYKNQTGGLKAELQDIPLVIEPATTDIVIYGGPYEYAYEGVSFKVQLPVFSHMDIPRFNRSVVKYREILIKKLSSVNRDIQLELSLDSKASEAYRSIVSDYKQAIEALKYPPKKESPF